MDLLLKQFFQKILQITAAMQVVISITETLTLQIMHQTTEQQSEQYRLSSGDRNITYGAALTMHNMSIFLLHVQILLNTISQSELLPEVQSARGPVPDLRCPGQI